MISARNVFIWIGAMALGLVALLNLAVGTYHTMLFATQGPLSMFTVAYGIEDIRAPDMTDRAHALGASAVVVYSMLLAGYGLLSLWATVTMVRGRWSGFWLNAIFVGISQLAVLYGLIIPGVLSGANGFTGPALYVVGIMASTIGLRLPSPRA